MFPVQPTCLWKYLGKKSSSLSSNLASKFYLSWEDGLWDILQSFNIPKKSVILVPSFFCEDVIYNMKKHHLRPVYYEVDDNLQPVESKLFQQIHTLKPALLVLLHAVGIQNKLIHKKFIQSLPKEMFVIEDGVHRIVDQNSVEILSDKHFVIDSLRKVVPLQGSFVISTKQTIAKLQGANRTTFIYSSNIIFLWFFMQLFLLLQKYLPFNVLKISAGRMAEICMKIGYDRIGDSYISGYCPTIFAKLFKLINVQQVKLNKVEQIDLYDSLLKIKSQGMYVPRYFHNDKKELRGYPVVISKPYASLFIQNMRAKGILIRAELDDSPWCTHRSIIYLPTGLHISENDIRKCISVFNDTTVEQAFRQ